MVQPIPPGCESIIPHLKCANCADIIEFYKQAFGAEEVCRLPAPDGQKIMHAAMTIGGQMVFLADDFPEYCNGKSETPLSLQGTPVGLHRYVKDCDQTIAQAQKAGATVIMPATDMFWGDRYGQVKDPAGHVWSFATHQKDMTPEEMLAASKACFEQA
ncbi:VOC family protein [Planctomicrobium sp. SH661]|uniref:VOC family protein n=1 Tax=Planctomicrobium sp. SH661 TaxID=3448124 RepID=UPI003F5BC7D1